MNILLIKLFSKYQIYFTAGFIDESSMISYMDGLATAGEIYNIIGIVLENFNASTKHLKYRLRAYMGDEYGQLFPPISLVSSMDRGK